MQIRPRCSPAYNPPKTSCGLRIKLKLGAMFCEASNSLASAFSSLYCIRLLPTPAILLFPKHIKLFLTSGPLHSHLLCLEYSPTNTFSSQIFRSFQNHFIYIHPGLESALSALQETIVKFLRILRANWHHFGSLKSATVGIFTPQKMANAKNWAHFSSKIWMLSIH